tara:strand:- start:245 stop:472 length:228 start_codon:yes stop_codon:yes gene_type:complete
MSREDFSNFIHAAEHHPQIRRELAKTKSWNEVIEIARKYRFSITLKDIKEEPRASETKKWFNESKILPFKKNFPN